MKTKKGDFLLEILNYISENNKELVFSGEAKDIYSFKPLTKKQISHFATFFDQNSNPTKCILELQGIEEFNPAFLSACSSHSFSFSDAKIGLISNYVELISNKSLQDSDFISIILDAVISTLDMQIDNIMLSLFDNVLANTKLLNIEFTNVCNHKILEFSRKHSELLEHTIPYLSFLLYTSIVNKETELVDETLNELNEVLPNVTETMPVFDDIIRMCIPLAISLDIRAMNVIGAIADIDTSQYIIDIFVKIARNALMQIMNSKTNDIVLLDTRENFLFIPDIDEKINIEMYLAIPGPVIEPDIDSLEVDSSVRIEKFFNDDQLRIIGLLRGFLHRTNPEPVISFLNDICSDIEKQTSKNAELWCLVVAIIQSIPQIEVPDMVINALVSPHHVLDPSINIFEVDREEMKVESRLRSLLIKTLLEFQLKKVKNLLIATSSFPALFTEVCCRILAFVVFQDLQQFFDSAIIELFSSVLHNCLTSISKKENTVPYRVWSALFFFIVTIFDDESTSQHFMSSYKFSQVFLYHMFSEHLHLNILTISKRFLISQSPTMSAIDHIVQFCYTLLDSSSPYVFEFIDLLQEVIAYKPHLANVFSQLLYSILNFFSINHSKENLQPVLSFILCLSMNDDLHFTSEQLRKLGEAIREAEPEGSSSQTITSLVSIISNSKSSSQSSLFVIKKPALIQILLSASFECLDEIIQMFYSLCKYSIYNRIQCHNGELDIMLIEALRMYPNGFSHAGIKYPKNFSKESINNYVVPLLNDVFETKCSLQAAERFIALAVPDENRIFPTYANSYILKLNSILSSAPFAPKIHEVFTKGRPKYSFKHLPISILENGFTFIGSIMFDKAIADMRIDPVIFSADAMNDTEILVYSNNGGLTCNVHEGERGKSATFAQSFESCKWLHFSITFIADRNNKYRIVYTLGKDESNLFMTMKPTFTSQEWTLEVGGFVNWNSEAEIPFCFLGEFLFFDSPLKMEQIYDFVDATPHVEQKNVAVTECLNDSQYITNVSTIAENQPLLECLIPFFQFPVESPPNFLEQVADLFVCLPKDTNFDGFKFILMNMNDYQPEYLTFSLYSHFAEVFIINQNEELFNLILFNPRLWIKSPFVNKIVSHWTNSLYIASQNMFEMIPLKDLFTMVRTLFWFKEDELSELVDQRHPNINVKQCREELNVLLMQLCKNRITNSDMEYLITMMHNINDDESLEYFLVLISYLAKDMEDTREFAKSMHFFLTTTSPNVFIAALKALTELAKGEVHKHIERITCRMTNIKVTHEILKTILDNAQSVPESIVLGALISTKLTQEDISDFGKCFFNISSNKDNAIRIRNIKTWYIWPIIAALASEKDVCSFIAHSLLNIIVSDPSMLMLDEIIAFLDILYLSNNKKAKNIIIQLLSGIADLILSDLLLERHSFVHRCARYILFQFNVDYFSGDVHKVFLDSPFNKDNEGQETTENFVPTSVDEIIESLETQRSHIHLLFKIETHKGELKYHDLLTRIVALTNSIKKCDHTTHLIVEVFNKLSTESTDDSLLWKQNLELASLIPTYSSVMDISYMKYLNETALSLSQYLKKVKGYEINDISESSKKEVTKSIISMHELIEKKKEKIDFEYRHFNNEYANELSIWKAFWKSDFYMTTSSLLTSSLQVATVQRKHEYMHDDFAVLQLQKEPKFHVASIRIRLSGQYPCSFILTKDEIILKSIGKEIHIKQCDVTHVLHRTNKHLSCLEFIVNTGKSYFIDFYPYSLADILPLMRKFHKPKYCIYQEVTFFQFIFEQNITKRWVHKRCSNLEYLLALNFYGGRSYNNLDSYPIMPVPVSDFETMSLPVFGDQTTFLQGQYTFLPLFKLFKKSLEKRSKTSNITKEELHDEGLIAIKDDKNGSLFEHSHPLSPREKVTPQKIIDHFSLRTVNDSHKELVDILNENKYLLTPEFFTFPECFDGLKLPGQFKTTFEFVHAMKKAIESSYVTAHLHEWINNIFGINQSKDSRVITLFKVPHPIIHEDEKCILQYQRSISVSDQSIVSATIKPISNTEVCFITVSSTSYATFVVDFENLTVHKKDHGKVNGFTHVTNRNIQFTDMNKGSITVVNEDKTKTYTKLQIPLFDFDGKTDSVPILCTHDGLAFSMDKGRIFGKCKVSPEVPVCVTSSERWHLTVVGVRSRKLIFYNRDVGNLLLSTKALNIPDHIIITESEGLVITAAGSFIEVFTANGTQIKEITTLSDVFYINSYRDRHGFDLIVYADKRGRISVIDPYEGTERTLIECQSRVVSINGSLLTGGLSIITKSGEAFFVPI